MALNESSSLKVTLPSTLQTTPSDYQETTTTPPTLTFANSEPRPSPSLHRSLRNIGLADGSMTCAPGYILICIHHDPLSRYTLGINFTTFVGLCPTTPASTSTSGGPAFSSFTPKFADHMRCHVIQRLLHTVMHDRLANMPGCHTWESLVNAAYRYCTWAMECIFLGTDANVQFGIACYPHLKELEEAARTLRKDSMGEWDDVVQIGVDRLLEILPCGERTLINKRRIEKERLQALLKAQTQVKAKHEARCQVATPIPAPAVIPVSAPAPVIIKRKKYSSLRKLMGRAGSVIGRQKMRARASAIIEKGKAGFYDRQKVQRMEPAPSMSRPAGVSCV
ncbi:hypothetical protein C343_05309 [Cryptococcus neoformans C23]|uniref:Uncharacterized protein n=1 Tax=Cryptococcus neoformans (strain H99 / ATCC 208821 / CBS 10515 / FGSC 9487) TaxID=235443 RepID=J9VX24_CRYN9|nr:hypothetical protein CNAG_04454 [Cryptococcus neoformans var. grubii H99]AUB27161.1 hypothetical protein CKF44_04454 [Cryptococcus neoformans var. grubii]OWZ28880.1 hypothetical protein C347_05356 [Cryptococcus neoformans var. grubii AD2-60a]OWZ35182.1 hypothetical protein C353_05206 [Cryptococcus neoformans var. grubii AD1-83a]OWZ40830.1 hypothetical protein C343_05309 [Cryptococcus neoformans var. grubii C23]OWZ51804.1 hypothetical protein C368_05468 [Cryptococcus neoformans var. grubii 1|eukprot:XP_012051810.1 hypothetical protein CNAG_04454 [Cryptococcus neoformans var. grubii H99]